MEVLKKYLCFKILQSKIKTVICGLGTGAHLEHWGYLKHNIIEKDWHEQISLDDGFTVNTVPARHFSGRTIRRNKTNTKGRKRYFFTKL